jgi:hypothetical protein
MRETVASWIMLHSRRRSADHQPRSDWRRGRRREPGRRMPAPFRSPPRGHVVAAVQPGATHPPGSAQSVVAQRNADSLRPFLLSGVAGRPGGRLRLAPRVDQRAREEWPPAPQRGVSFLPTPVGRGWRSRWSTFGNVRFWRTWEIPGCTTWTDNDVNDPKATSWARWTGPAFGR